jgi:hypothetical protein
MHSYDKVGISMATSRWIFRMISPPATTVIPINASKCFTSWTSTARLLLQKLPNLRGPPLHKGAEEEVDAAEGVVTEKSHGNFDKEYWKDKNSYKCEKKGHPANRCPKKSNNDDDEKSVARAASSVKKLKKEFKSMKKAFNTVNTQLEKLKEADSDLSGSEDDDDQSHFQMDTAFLFTQVDKEFEPISSSKQVPWSRSTSGRSSYWTVSPLWIFSVMHPW